MGAAHGGRKKLGLSSAWRKIGAVRTSKVLPELGWSGEERKRATTVGGHPVEGHEGGKGKREERARRRGKK